MEREYIPVTDTAKLIRLVLKESFSSVKFSVKSSKYSGGASIDIHYTDGPAPELVDDVSVRSPVFRAVIIHKELEREAKRALSRPQRTIH